MTGSVKFLKMGHDTSTSDGKWHSLYGIVFSENISWLGRQSGYDCVRFAGLPELGLKPWHLFSHRSRLEI